MAKEWFYNWFNSPYYHLLYNKRNGAEAEYFINNLIACINPRPGARLLDIACGRGRHAVYLNKKGYRVTAFDLSVQNIRFARKFENDALHFFVHDMRMLYYNNYFDAAFNLFTSFGYFTTEEEHISSLQGFNRALKPGGLLVLDYFNSHKVVKNKIADEVKTVKGLDFHIHKNIEGDKIIKTIKFEDGGKSYDFREAVSLFDTVDFERLFSKSGFMVINKSGTYGLDNFDAETSDRLIFICKKSDA